MRLFDDTLPLEYDFEVYFTTGFSHMLYFVQLHRDNLDI